MEKKELKVKIGYIDNIRRVFPPGLSEQTLSFHFFSFQPAYRKAFRREAFEAPYPGQGSQAVGSRKGEDFAVISAKSPTILTEHPQARLAFQGNRIIQVDGSPAQCILPLTSRENL